MSEVVNCGVAIEEAVVDDVGLECELVKLTKEEINDLFMLPMKSCRAECGEKNKSHKDWLWWYSDE